MSGIYIPGMEMPNCCQECPLVDTLEGCPCREMPDEEFWNPRGFVAANRHKDCPLIPVPPHGRLIDADEAIGHLFNGEQCLYSWDEIEDAIDATETIIPAEEGE